MNRLIYILKESGAVTTKTHLFNLNKVNIDTRLTCLANESPLTITIVKGKKKTSKLNKKLIKPGGNSSADPSFKLSKNQMYIMYA